ncbi:MAG: hypothetical protein EBR82_33470 [Caulobacteraceae bacterium]|nr:hypothetical protein [Caulobacteraceae bacterium]
MSTSTLTQEDKVLALNNILATPVGTTNITQQLFDKASKIVEKDPGGKVDTPFGNLFARDAAFLYSEFNKLGVSDPSKLSAQVVGDGPDAVVKYTDGTTGNVIQEVKVSEGGSLKLGLTGGKTGDVKGYDLYMVPGTSPGGQTNLTLASEKVAPGQWVKFRDNILKPVAIAAAAYFGEPLLGEALGITGAGAGTAGAAGAGATAASGLAVAGVEGAAAQAALSAQQAVLAAGGTAAAANIAADVAAGNVAAGLSVADAVAAGTTTAKEIAALGAVDAAGNIVGGGGAITAGTTGSLLTGANALANTAAGSTLANTAANAAKAATPGLLSNAISAGANLALINDAAQKLRDQGKISQEEYSKLAGELESKYTNLGLFGQQGLYNVGKEAAGMVGQFTPYGVTNQLFGSTVNPETGALQTNLTAVGEALYSPFARVAAQSAQAAEMTNVDQLAQDYYNKVAALSAPETARQRLALEERMRAQGRLGLLSSTVDPVTGREITTSAPELLAQEQAIARQQLERELQSRQAALGERGTLIGQGTAAYSPISNLLAMQAQQQQQSAQLGQMAQQGRIAAAQLFAQPAAQGYTNAVQAGIAGLGQTGQTERLGIASNLAAQQAALDALAVGRTNAANTLLSPEALNPLVTAGTNIIGSAADKLLGSIGLG